MKTSRSRFLETRGVRHHLREWGEAGAPQLFLLHGFLDVSAAFQFLVDELRRDWHVIAPDWRGFGLSRPLADCEAYWFPDYLADLDALLEHCSPAVPVRLVGHSMGGNVAAMYAGVRPARVRELVSLDAFGLASVPAGQAPLRLERWLQQLREPQAYRMYADAAALAARLMADNPRLTAERARFLAEHLGQPVDGGWQVAADPAHRRVNPVLYRREEAEACWRRVRARVLWVSPEDDSLARRLHVSPEDLAHTRACFADLCQVSIPGCGHNLHVEQPAALARAIEDFLDERPAA